MTRNVMAGQWDELARTNGRGLRVPHVIKQA